MMATLCPYASSGGERLVIVIKNTSIEVEEEIDETTSHRRVQSEPPMNRYVGADKESTTLPIMTNMEDHTTDAGSVTPRSVCSTAPSSPSHPPQNAPRAIQETAAASFISQPHTFRWTVDAKKMSSSDTSAVSPPFELPSASPGAPLRFKMVLEPEVGCGSFKRARGRGRIGLKCLAPPCDRPITMMTVRFSAGKGRGEEALQSSRFLVEHNFAQTALAKDPEIWDFTGLFDETSPTFLVCLTVLSPWH